MNCDIWQILAMQLLQKFPNLNLFLNQKSKQTTMVYFIETETETVEVFLAILEVT